MIDVDLEDLLTAVAAELGPTPAGEALRAVLGGGDAAEALAVLERQTMAARSRLVRVRPGEHGSVVVWRPRQKTPA